jgi:glycosyltransferase involved in cell wall biosynthesis
VVHLVTIKPVIYGGIAARVLGLPALAAVTGLGHAFTGGGFLKRGFQAFLLAMYRFALGGKGCHVVVQNESDERTLQSLVRTPVDRLSLIPGSGVELAQYPVHPEPEGPLVVVMAARLLRDKGVFDYLAAARLVRQRHPDTTFLLAGDPDPGNPSSLTQGDLEAIRAEGVVDVCGYQKDIPALFARSNLVVLPSYREGLPKVLIEAAACGRAVITTDAPGCRDAVLPDESALVVPVAAPEILAGAIIRLLEDPALRRRLGATGRILAESRFDIGQVIQTHLSIYEQLLGR